MCRKAQFFTVIFPLPLLFISFLFLPLVENYDYDKDVMAPVILVPGVGGSQIRGKWHTHGHPENCDEKSDGWKYLWLPLDIAIMGKHYLRCWAYRFQVLYDKKTHTCRNQNGVVTHVKGRFGSLKSCEFAAPSPLVHFKTGYYHFVIKRLEKRGYSSDHSLKAAGYDWRFTPLQLEEFGYYRQLTELVEHIAADTKRKVTIVAHSMGGLVISYFLINKTQEWKDKHINSFISIATPWLGSILTLRSYAVGNNYGLSTVDPTIMKELLRTFPAVAFLMPQEEEYKDEVLLEWVTESRLYTGTDYQQFFTDVGYEDAYLMRQDVRSLFPVPLNKLGVPYFCIWSNDSTLSTPTRFWVVRNLRNATPYEIETSLGEGDSTVQIASLRYCERFKGVTVKSFQGFTHTGIIADGVFTDYLMSLLVKAQPFS